METSIAAVATVFFVHFDADDDDADDDDNPDNDLCFGFNYTVFGRPCHFIFLAVAAMQCKRL